MPNVKVDWSVMAAVTPAFATWTQTLAAPEAMYAKSTKRISSLVVTVICLTMEESMDANSVNTAASLASSPRITHVALMMHSSATVAAMEMDTLVPMLTMMV